MRLFSNSITNFVDNYGRKYKGNFKYSKLKQWLEGNGIMTNEEGDVYEGQFGIYCIIKDNYINLISRKADWIFRGTVKIVDGHMYGMNVEYGRHASINVTINNITSNDGKVYEGNIYKINNLLFDNEEFRLDKFIQEGYFKGKLVSSTGEVYELSNFNGDGITLSKGKLIYPTGKIYEGEFDVNMNPKGEGELIDNDGSIYKGNFSECGILNGQKICENGLIYEGNFDTKRNMIGIGKLICKNQPECEVEFDENGILKRKIYKNGIIEEGKFNEKGILVKGKIIDENGNLKEGEFNKNKSLIKGKIQWANGDIEEGEFNEVCKLINGINIDKNGYARKVYPTGRICEGNLNVNGKLEGKGKIIYPTGEIYEGRFNIKEQLEGKGRIIYSNGEIYEGNFNKNEKLEGKGKIIYPNGEVYEGIFENGILPPIEIKNLEIIYREVMDDFVIQMKIINKYYKPIRKVEIVTILLDKNKLPLLNNYDNIESYYTLKQNIMPQEESDTIQLIVDDNRIIDQVEIFIQDIEFFGAPKWENKNIDNIIEKYNNKFFV